MTFSKIATISPHCSTYVRFYARNSGSKQSEPRRRHPRSTSGPRRLKSLIDTIKVGKHAASNVCNSFSPNRFSLIWRFVRVCSGRFHTASLFPFLTYLSVTFLSCRYEHVRFTGATLCSHIASLLVLSLFCMVTISNSVISFCVIGMIQVRMSLRTWLPF